MKHKLCINVAGTEGTQPVLESRTETIPNKLFRKLFKGEKSSVIVLTPGNSVESIEIREVAEGKDG